MVAPLGRAAATAMVTVTVTETASLMEAATASILANK